MNSESDFIIIYEERNSIEAEFLENNLENGVKILLPALPETQKGKAFISEILIKLKNNELTTIILLLDTIAFSISRHLFKEFIDLAVSVNKTIIICPLRKAILPIKSWNKDGYIWIDVKDYNNIQRTINSLRKSNSKMNVNSDIHSSRNYYLVGSIWEDEEQDLRFYDAGIWENGYDDKFSSDVNNVKENDIVIIKSTFQAGGEGYLRIKAIGLVKKNVNNGKLLYVDWKLKSEKIDINGLSNFRTTITKIDTREIKIILSKIDQSKMAQVKLLFLLKENRMPLNIKDPDEEDRESDKIPFHIDRVENTDRLNREPSAKSLTRLLNNEIFNTNNEMNHGFMIHLQGEWGDGKSTFLNLIEQNINSLDNNWIVVKYNAWRNQHIDPPWWSFINDVYRQSREKIPGLLRVFFRIKENSRRIIKYQSSQKLMSLTMAIVFSYIIFRYRLAIFNFSNKSLQVDGIIIESKGIALEVFAKLITALGAVVGLIYSFSKFLSSPLFLRSSSTAKSFMERSTNPMKKVKTHYESLVDDINSSGYQLAIFIDDLDRCNDKFTVELLEGIQTLFKDKKVLFVVAGDRNWICQCFENHYTNYKDITRKPAQKLGYLFLEKAFQLSIRLPKISVETKASYWNYILNLKPLDNINRTTKQTELERVLMIKEIKNKSKNDDLFNPEYLKNLKQEFKIGEQEIVDIALELIDRNTEDVRHRLINHHVLIDTNPRSIKRLSNEYTMYRNILTAVLTFENEVI
jgi:hypothetical protein